MRAGFTLIEMTVTLAVAAVLFAAAVVGVGALTGAEARASAGQLAGAAQSLFDQAALSGKTCRLVFELPSKEDEDGKVSYRAECAEKGLTAARDRDAFLRDEADRSREAAKDRTGGRGRDARVFVGADSDAAKGLEELLTEEEQRVERSAAFGNFTNNVVEPRELPSSVRLAVWVRGQREYTEEGPAMLYFFPQGYTEKAQVLFTQGDDAWTLKLEPLTGRVSVVAEALEVPRT